ncbi:MAG TPA: hypothetical protein VFG24_06805 [Nitrosopumilaceae archaeon]|nr:hypothetical protein [Nitrosopumilaceae archaeon]
MMREESSLLQKMDPQKNPELVLDTVNALQEFERVEYQRLDDIKRAIKDGKTIPKHEIMNIVGRYEKLQHEAENKKKVQWTISVIKKLQQSMIGNFEIMDVIKNKLEEEITLDESEINYLKENWKQLRKIKQ